MSFIAGIGVSLLVFIMLLSFYRRAPQLTIVLMGGLLLRIILNYYEVYLGDLPGNERDAVMFHNTGEAWSRHGFWACFEYFTTGRHLYAWLVAVSYSLVGPDPFFMVSLNVALSILTALVLANDIFLLSQSRRGAVLGAALFCYFPTIILYSVTLLRESLIVFLLTIAISGFIRYVKQNSVLPLLISLFMLLAASLLHTGFLFAVVTLGCLVLIQWIWMREKLNRMILLNMAVGLIMLVIGATVFVGSGLGLEKAGGDAGNLVNLERVQRQVSVGDAHTRAGYLKDMVPRTWLDLTWQAPIRLAYFLLAPFPWMIRSSLDLLGLLMAIPTIALIAWYILRIRTIWSEPACRALSIYLLMMLLVFAMGTRNYGAAMRHKTKFLATALVMLAPTFRLPASRMDTLRRPP